jgi:nuclear pore complex protein Nup98-Nup96
MPPYEGKSFEELRFEDYSQGNKGTGGAQQPGAIGGFGGFGAPAAAPSTSLFGGSTSPAPAPFGAAPTSGFGGFSSSPAPATSFGEFFSLLLFCDTLCDILSSLTMTL